LILGMHKVSRASFASTYSETNSQADPWSLHDSEEVLAWVLKNCSSPDENSQYLKPISSAYRVIENHARATEAGVRELAKAMIARLAPQSLVQSEPTSRMYNLFPVLQRARLWNLARKRYDKLQRQWEAEVGPELVKIFFDAYQAEQKDAH